MTGSPGTVTRVGGMLLDAVFPKQCVRCGAFGRFVCGECAAGMMPATGERCRVCWAGGHDLCERCAFRRPAFKAARSAYVYDSEPTGAYRHDAAVRAAVHALKYRGVSALAPVMAAPMAALLREWAPAADVIVPVPLFGMRKRTRGYNQSELLAREIGRATGLPVETGAVVRKKATPPQARLMGYDARAANIRGAFAPGRWKLAGAGVLVIDDVMTTGATLDACSRVLLEGGAGAVFALTYARED